MENLMQNNKIYLEGEVISELKFSHKMSGEGFYIFSLQVQRLSENKDILDITISERLIANMNLELGTKVVVEGQLRSYNKYVGGSNRLILTVFARNIELCMEKSKNPNQIYLNGFLCKQPIYRTTPFGREITDMLLAVNRPYNKSDYIPIIAWGRNARFCKVLEVGDNIKIWGRLQSRQYQKKISDAEVVKKVAYEVSISKMEKVSDEDENYIYETDEVEKEIDDNIDNDIESESYENQVVNK